MCIAYFCNNKNKMYFKLEYRYYEDRKTSLGITVLVM
jgi:hypothetical protein